MDMREFVAANKITAAVEQADDNPNMEQDSKYPMDHWRVAMRHKGRRFTVYFSMGLGHHGKEPEVAEVLDCLISDATGVDNARGFEDWCGDYGYDTDSRKAHRTYTVCARQGERLRKFLGADLYQQLNDVERM
jgi:hypothetical protein